jgi:hypothetical protein
MLSIVKPRQFLSFENKLAEQLGMHGCLFVPEAVIGLVLNPDYPSNRDLFQCKPASLIEIEVCSCISGALSWMRKSIQESNAGVRRQVVGEYAKALQLVMAQMKADLKTVASDPGEHGGFVAFVRDIISLIRSHGSEICTIDEFFYQMSQEYAPSVQDPRLHVAGMVSYGLRLSEGDSRVAPQLFYYLYNNFKLGLAKDKLIYEAIMLRKGMKNPGILSFVLGAMLPAAIRATVEVNDAYPLLDVYSHALRCFLTRSVAPFTIEEDNLPSLSRLLKVLLQGLRRLVPAPGEELSEQQIHILRQLVSIIDALRPSTEMLSYTAGASDAWQAFETMLDRFSGLTDDAELAFRHVMDGPCRNSLTLALFNGLRNMESDPEHGDAQVDSFADNIITDVRKNWVFSADAITIQAPARGRGTQTSTQGAQGSKWPVWNMGELADGLEEQLRVWTRWWRRWKPGSSTRDISEMEGEFLF